MQLIRMTNRAIVMSWRALTLLVGAMSRIFLWVTGLLGRRVSSWRRGDGRR
jgi:hypothetical protein